MDISALYRKFVPYRIRHGLRQAYYFMRCRVLHLEPLLCLSLESYGKSNPNEIETLNTFPIHFFASFPRYKLTDTQKFDCTIEVSGHVYKLINVCCYAYSGVIKLNNGKYFYDLRNTYLRLGKTISCSDGKVWMVDEPKYYHIKKFNEKRNLHTGILFTDIFSGNYYHFTLSILPKLDYLKQIPESVPLLVDNNVRRIASYQQLIRLCDEQNRKLVFMDDEVEYQVEELYTISPLMIACPQYRKNQPMAIDDDLYNGHTIDWLRNKLLGEKAMISTPKRFFISRKKASGLRKFNENECISVLTKYGFEVVYPENLSITEQVALFNNAEFIIGGSGAAFTNLIYANEHTNVIILEGYKSNICIFSSVAAHLNLNLIYLCDNKLGNISSGYDIHSDFEVNVGDLEELIIQMLKDNE